MLTHLNKLYDMICERNPRYDGWRNGHLPSDFMTWRGLRESLNGRGGIDVLNGMYDLREYLFAKVIGCLVENWICVILLNSSRTKCIASDIPVLQNQTFVLFSTVCFGK